jgi:hypothetical protein
VTNAADGVDRWRDFLQSTAPKQIADGTLNLKLRRR